jgi:phage FluMu protein Com
MRHEWRCAHCGRLLGVLEGARLHIRFARGHQYLAGFPASATCRSCGTLNELRDGTRATAAHGAGSR